jgi:hypothetical protein
MVNRPGEFLWSSYPAFIRIIKTPDWMAACHFRKEEKGSGQ